MSRYSLIIIPPWFLLPVWCILILLRNHIIVTHIKYYHPLLHTHDKQTSSSTLHGNHPRIDSKHWTIFPTWKLLLYSLFLISFIVCILYYNITPSLQASNYLCITLTLHTSGNYPSRCWVAWRSTLPPPSVGENTYAVVRNEK